MTKKQADMLTVVSLKGEPVRRTAGAMALIAELTSLGFIAESPAGTRWVLTDAGRAALA